MESVKCRQREVRYMVLTCFSFSDFPVKSVTIEPTGVVTRATGTAAVPGAAPGIGAAAAAAAAASGAAGASGTGALGTKAAPTYFFEIFFFSFGDTLREAEGGLITCPSSDNVTLLD